MESKQETWHAGHIGIGEFRREVVFDADHGQVCEVVMRGEAGEIHARLLAAAPDLLAVVERFAARMEASGEAWMSNPDWIAAYKVLARVRGTEVTT